MIRGVMVIGNGYIMAIVGVIYRVYVMWYVFHVKLLGRRWRGLYVGVVEWGCELA
jgi:hypothetical protein